MAWAEFILLNKDIITKEATDKLQFIIDDSMIISMEFKYITGLFYDSKVLLDLTFNLDELRKFCYIFYHKLFIYLLILKVDDEKSGKIE